VLPASGPGLMIRAFSGSFQRVVGVTAFQSSQRPKPRPPMKTSFICGVTGFSSMLRVPRSMER